MVKKLQYKFIGIATGSVFLMLLLVLAMINIISSVRNNRETGILLEHIANNNGHIPAMHASTSDYGDLDSVLTPETQYETRYFSVRLKNDQIVGVDNGHIAAVSFVEAGNYAKAALARGKERGRFLWNGRSYDYLVRGHGDQEVLVVVVDTTKMYYSTVSLVRFSAYVGLVMVGLFFLMISSLSRRVLKPIIDNIESQKQFITNASHELKTPLAIISANTEVLEMTAGESEWTQSIRNQIDRLTGLINRLITLARLQEGGESKLEEISASMIAKDVVASFKPVALQQGKEYESHIEDEVTVIAEERSFRELISILLDNAAKYCDDGGKVETTLRKKGKGLVMTVSNTYAAGATVDYDRFFERFYREDQSHNSEKKGYGIGLSMAKEMVEQYKGSLHASYKDGSITFTVTI
ncbi:MAG: HAMP domain-containing histidine kinase [Lachnospiraceae bacterium]|nr:HAMP domain-containing histidine kinase [Lachnospiraceae bacterium]